MTPADVSPASSPKRRTLHRDDLLAAVARYIADNGLHKFTLRQAAAAAGVTHKVLLYHFGSSDALVVEALDLIRIMATNVGRDAVESVPDADLRSLLDGVWRVWAREDVPTVLTEALGLAIADPDRFGAAGARATDDYRQAFRTGFEPYADEVGADGDVFATLLLAVLRGLSLDRDVTGDTDRVDAAFAAFRDALAPTATT